MNSHFANKKRLLALLVLVLAIPFTILVVRTVQEVRQRAAGGVDASLRMPSTFSTQVNQTVDVPITLSTDGVGIRGVDVVLNFDRTKLQVVSVTPNAQSPTTLKTFAPVTSSGAFDTTRVVNDANSDGRLEFGAVTYDWGTQATTAAYNGATTLATVRFRGTAQGSIPVTFQFAANSTTDTNIVRDVNPPQDLLTQASQLTNTTITVSGLPTATPTTLPCVTPTTVPVSPLVYRANLNGAQEVPANSSPATAVAYVTLNSTETSGTISMTMCASALTSAQTAAHIHGPAPVGVNANVAYSLPNGSFSNFNLGNLSQQQVQDLKDGLWYINIHTANNVNGEIRGQFASTLNVTPTTGTGPSVTSLTLVDAENEQDIQTLTNGATINLLSLPTQELNIRANTAPSTVGSVQFSLTGAMSHSTTENISPYVLFGDNNGNYNSWTPQAGTYTLTARPYTGSGATGTAGQLVTITFTVTQSGATPTPTRTPTPTVAQPTATPTRTPTPQPGSTVFNFILKLHGIGNGGDSVTPGSTGNTNPLNPQRAVTVQVLDGSNNVVLSRDGNVTYNTGTGFFNGSVNMGTTLASGPYLVRVKSPKYLQRAIPGIQTITAGQSVNMATVELVLGDVNNDNTLNILDYNLISDCYSDLAPPRDCSDPAKKASTDITDDGNVNQFDYNIFIRELSVRQGE